MGSKMCIRDRHSPMSFIADKIVMDGLTYDDVLLIPAYSEVLPKTVELSRCV